MSVRLHIERQNATKAVMRITAKIVRKMYFFLNFIFFMRQKNLSISIDNPTVTVVPMVTGELA